MKKLFIIVFLVSLSTFVKAQPNVFANPYAFQQYWLQRQQQEMKQAAKNFKFNFDNVQQSTPVQQNNNYNSESNTPTQQQTKQTITKTCGVCHGTGTCNNCGGKGWVSRMGMGKDGPCPVCPNHNGKCSSCGGRGSWKE